MGVAGRTRGVVGCLSEEQARAALGLCRAGAGGWAGGSISDGVFRDGWDLGVLHGLTDDVGHARLFGPTVGVLLGSLLHQHLQAKRGEEEVLGLSFQYIRYHISGFLSLQKVVDDFLFSRAVESGAARPGARAPASSGLVLTPFPTGGYDVNIFFGILIEIIEKETVYIEI